MTAWLAEMHVHTLSRAVQLRSTEACIARAAVAAASAGTLRAQHRAHVPLCDRPLLLDTD